MRKDAIDRARLAFAELPQGDALFQQCISDQETICSVLETLSQKAGVYKHKRSTRLLESFHGCTAWMKNISESIDVAVQTSWGIACPIWAPIKFVLKVRSSLSIVIIAKYRIH